MFHTIGEIIRAGRERRGWNQAQLAERIGVTGSFIGKLEKDEALPSVDRLIVLSNVLGLEKETLLSLSERRKEERAQSRIRVRGLAARTAYGLTDSQMFEQGSNADRSGSPIPGNDADPDLQRAYRWLKLIFDDPAVKNAAMTMLESLALKVSRTE